MRRRRVRFWAVRLDRLVDGSLLVAAALVVVAAWYGATLEPGWGSLGVLAPLEPLRPDRAVYRVPTREPWVALAVNVDWGDEVLPQMLDLFKREGVRVTFFPTGRWASHSPGLVRRMAADGHEVGNHGFTHDHPRALADGDLARLIRQNEELIASLAGEQPRLFAPPYGEVDDRVARVASDLGYWTVMWTIDTIDWQRPAPARIVQRVVPRLAAGAIVLMHPTEPTLAALPEILAAIREKGLAVVPVGQLIEQGSLKEPKEAAPVEPRA
ncbi:polysaccharide deacetylase family protein [Limnochorda pilosa]|uniref:Polysaccharide deacetylase n=1 Tax=Limnochorda pilosa TaxID=1555112 RepID=A0A0K2SMR5_LIMPI|nr:polysaccharide deacetylase family protein [Limnochorda pilosa]BAS28406.1 polysaccharide deacetylase [Limnochorda pilosa]